jgi:hypothetical protein
MDVAVERPVVQGLVCKEVVEIFEDEEACYLEGGGLPRGEGDLPCLHAEELGEGVEEPYSGKFDGKVGE